jgi:hypothetical protein
MLAERRRAFQDGEIGQGKRGRARIEAVHNFLTGTFFGMLWPCMEKMKTLLEKAPTFSQIRRRFRFEDKLNLLCEIFHIVDLQCERHAPSRSHRVDGDWEPGRLAVDRRIFEKQRLPAFGRFHFAIRPFRDQQICFDWDGNARQLFRFFQRVDELPK